MNIAGSARKCAANARAIAVRRSTGSNKPVTPAKAGVSWRPAETSCPEIPASAGMTRAAVLRRLLAALAPGLGDLPQDHLALQAGEMIDEEDAVEMIHLMLEADREQAGDLLLVR